MTPTCPLYAQKDDAPHVPHHLGQTMISVLLSDSALTHLRSSNKWQAASKDNSSTALNTMHADLSGASPLI